MGYLFSWPSLSKFAVEEWLNRSEILIILAGFVLAFGAIGEYLDDHSRLPKWMAWPKLAFILMVVISLIGEFVGDAGVFVFSKELQRIEGNEVDALDRRAKAAGNDAAKAIGDAAKAANKSQDALNSASASANAASAAKVEADSYEGQIRSALQQAAAAEKELTEARNQAAAANTKALEAQRALDAYKAARVLSPQQQRKMETALEGFAGTPYEVAVCSNSECIDLLRQIDSVLMLAGWTEKPSARKDLRTTINLGNGLSAEQAFTSGIIVGVSKPGAAKLGDAARALASELNAVGISAQAGYLADNDPSPDNVHVIVGNKQ
ncbi:MAG: hypothetical protein JO097_04535 [Acidobacteriaceae bacterium]|nr:hypothetical protein [Acidobacteriaceae bacterium]MBV9296024.1 hypothetical protein [Acidobacteriaceae bacterium]MBV9767617.1 hypothetical protein [Acidobacteriaceae bacterium]